MYGYKKTKVNDNLNGQFYQLHNYQARIMRKNYYLNDYHQEFMQHDRLLANNQIQSEIDDALLAEFYWDTNV